MVGTHDFQQAEREYEKNRELSYYDRDSGDEHEEQSKTYYPVIVEFSALVYVESVGSESDMVSEGRRVGSEFAKHVMDGNDFISFPFDGAPGPAGKGNEQQLECFATTGSRKATSWLEINTIRATARPTISGSLD